MPAQSARPIYRSGEWEIDLARRELRLRGVATPHRWVAHWRQAIPWTQVAVRDSRQLKIRRRDGGWTPDQQARVGIGGACEGQSTLIVHGHDERIIVVKVSGITVTVH
jgi:hypothetical protein